VELRQRRTRRAQFELKRDGAGSDGGAGVKHLTTEYRNRAYRDGADPQARKDIVMNTATKMALTLSTLAVIAATPAASSAQEFVTYSSAYGSANATFPTAAPADGTLGALDWVSQTVPRQHRTRTGR
jgi:hypothetical protein